MQHQQSLGDRLNPGADEAASFVVAEEQMYHVASGAVYHVENLGDGETEVILALRSERPKYFYEPDRCRADDRLRAGLRAACGLEAALR